MITISKGIVKAKTREGYKNKIPLEKFISIINPPELDLVLPNGVKMIRWQGNTAMVVYEMGPGAHALKWNYTDTGFRDRNLTIALPYVVLMIPFYYDRDNGRLSPCTSATECYFRNEPITDIDDKLFHSALLNSGSFSQGNYVLPSWMCTTKLYWSLNSDNNTKRLWRSIAAVKTHLLGSAFNSEWSSNREAYIEWPQADPRIKDIKEWAKATEKDPSFILDVKWLPAERNLRETVEYTLTGLTGGYTKSLERTIIDHNT